MLYHSPLSKTAIFAKLWDPFPTLVFVILLSTSARGTVCGAPKIEVDPKSLTSAISVKLTLSVGCSNSCASVCDVIGNWTSETEYHIDWYLDYVGNCPDTVCLTVSTLESTDVTLGNDVLDPGSYTVTATTYLNEVCDSPCLEGTQIGDTVQVMFTYEPPIPTISQWGLAAMTLLIMTAGTVMIRRSREQIISR